MLGQHCLLCPLPLEVGVGWGGVVVVLHVLRLGGLHILALSLPQAARH